MRPKGFCRTWRGWRGGQPTALHALLIASGARGYDKALISRAKDARQSVSCKVGQWSDWRVETFDVAGKRKRGAVRFKLIELSPDAERVWLYHSQVYPLDEFTYPQSLGPELTKKLGPFIHEAAWNSRQAWKLCDDATCEEELSYHAEWIGRAAKYIFQKLDIRVYYQHYHLLDSLNHSFLGHIDPVGAGYGKKPLEACWAAFRQGYRMVDKMVGEVTKAADENTVIAVCSDHGDVPNRRAVWLWNLFLQRGWVTLKSGPDGKPQIDWPRTKVCYDQNHVWLNVASRDPDGCVKSKDYERFRDEVLDAMLDLKDPQDGKRCIGVALRREDAVYMGLYGPATGDIVFYYGPGFRWSGPEVFRMGQKAVVFDDPGGANHGPQPPAFQTEVSDNAGGLILAGPGVRKGYVRDSETAPPMFTADLVPTLAHLAGLEPPRHAEGKVVRDLLAGYPGRMRRSHRRFDVIPKPAAKKKPTLAGDVTDEE